MPFSITSITLASWMSIPPAGTQLFPLRPPTEATTATANTTFWRTTSRSLLRPTWTQAPLSCRSSGNVCSLDGHFGSGTSHPMLTSAVAKAGASFSDSHHGCYASQPG